jgi:hypothetical protein
MTEQLPFFRRPGALLLALAIGFLVVMIICAATPIVWILMGSPAEEYPELAFAAFGIPLGLLLVAASGGYYWWRDRERRDSSPRTSAGDSGG